MKLEEDIAKFFVEKVVEEANREMISNIEYTWTKIIICFTQMTKDILGELEVILQQRRIQCGVLIRSRQLSRKRKKKYYLALENYKNE